MPRKYFRKYLPNHEDIRGHKYLSRFGAFLQHPNLWHLNRRSVAGGVAVGMFCGLIPGPLQMLGAALMAIPLRVNLPVALFTTLYTNPITIVPLYILAFGIGRLLVGAEGSMVPPPDFTWAHLGDYAFALIHWMKLLGKPLAVGLVALAIGLALAGWLIVQCAWRIYVIASWQRRKKVRGAR